VTSITQPSALDRPRRGRTGTRGPPEPLRGGSDTGCSVTNSSLSGLSSEEEESEDAPSRRKKPWRYRWPDERARGDRTVKITDTPPTIREFTHRVAQLGRFLGRKSDGDPGTQTLARGIATFDVIVLTYEIFRETHAPP